jgi:hypothetical protein
VSYDLQVALEVSRGQWKPQPINLVIDPPVDWVAQWVVQLESAAYQDPASTAVACDMETPDKAGGKPENELGPDDESYDIQRWNFACHPDEGLTLPNHPAYHPWIKRILELGCYHYWWNGSGYDWDRTRAAGYQPIARWQIDLMLAAHILQSDVPLGLGFWAPFYSNFGAWKHRSSAEPEVYACIDGPQTLRVGYGIIGDLLQHGMWRAFEEDCHELYHAVLKPAQDIGILIDKAELTQFHEDLAVKQRRLLHEIQGVVPEVLRPLTQETKRAPTEGVVHPAARTHNLRTGEALKDQPDPLKQDLFALGAVRVSQEVRRVIKVCVACGKEEVHVKHRCEDKTLTPQVELQEKLVVRWFWQEPFNPDSAQQVLGYLKYRKHKPGKSKQTREDSADRETLQRLWRTTQDPLYKYLLDYRAIKKVDSTYAVPTMRRIDKELAAGREPRIHPIPTFRPSMHRLSYISPNITNVVADKDKKQTLAAGFRRCVVAAAGCRLLEVDFSGIEAVETGWYARDPAYIRLARLGVHAYLASHLLGRPADLRWSDADLIAYFAELKKVDAFTYDKAKRCVHGTNYGLTPMGMAMTFPDLYKDIAAADKVQRIYFEVCPALPTWHAALRQFAYDKGWLGGPGAVITGEDNSCYTQYLKNPNGYSGAPWWPHPFQYKHWFWSVLQYTRLNEKQYLWRQKRGMPTMVNNEGVKFGIGWGEDSKRVIALYPQSTAAGVLKRSARPLFARPDHPSYIGTTYYDRTPLRAPIHDSFLLEVPERAWDRVVEAVAREMQRPIAEQPVPAGWAMGTHLTVGIEAKAGRNWLEMEKIEVPSFQASGVIESDQWPVEEQDEDDWGEMGVVA